MLKTGGSCAEGFAEARPLTIARPLLADNGPFSQYLNCIMSQQQNIGHISNSQLRSISPADSHSESKVNFVGESEAQKEITDR